MNSPDLLTAILASAVLAALPLILAGLGELVAERAGMMNLGVEGMMLTGAAVAFLTMVQTQNFMLSVAAGAGAGLALSLVFAFCTVTLLASQVPTGLAIMALGTGLSSYIGKSLTASNVPTPSAFPIPILEHVPVVGPALFTLPIIGYLPFVMCGLLGWLLFRTRIGLLLNAVGESPVTAYQLGYSVNLVKYIAVLFGGAMAGLAGAYYSIGYVLLWQDGMTAGRGWMAIALVLFSAWKPLRLVLGAILFGATSALQFHAQSMGMQIPSQFLACLPYVTTIAVLAYIAFRTERHSDVPRSLGRTFHPLLNKLV